MKRSLSHGSGYLEIDHRDSPGLTPADVAHLPGTLAIGAGERLERDVQTCSHCQRGVALNPGRVRARAFCPKCHHYICDACNAIRVKSGACVPMAAVLDDAASIAMKYLHQPDHPDAVTDHDTVAHSRAARTVILTDAP